MTKTQGKNPTPQNPKEKRRKKASETTTTNTGGVNTPSPPTKSFDFGGFDSSKFLILQGGNSHVHIFYRESPGKFDSRTLSRETLSRWTGRTLTTATDGSGTNHILEQHQPLDGRTGIDTYVLVTRPRRIKIHR